MLSLWVSNIYCHFTRKSQEYKLYSLSFVTKLLTFPECLLFYNRRLKMIFYSFFTICTVINILQNVIHSIVNLNFNLFFPFPGLPNVNCGLWDSNISSRLFMQRELLTPGSLTMVFCESSYHFIAYNIVKQRSDHITHLL